MTTDKSETERDWARAKRLVLFWLVVTIIINAVFDVVVKLPYHDIGFAIFATTGLAAFFAFAWVRLDAKERGIDFRALGVAIALLTKLALPIYFIHTRGWVDGLLANLATVIFLVALLGVYALSVEVTLYFLRVIS